MWIKMFIHMLLNDCCVVVIVDARQGLKSFSVPGITALCFDPHAKEQTN